MQINSIYIFSQEACIQWEISKNYIRNKKERKTVKFVEWMGFASEKKKVQKFWLKPRQLKRYV